ncbi:hypothetical protein ACIQUY_04920 [Streptomyces sp. NPDC090231]
MIGDGPGLRIIHAEPDEEPVERTSRATRSAWPWMTDEFLGELESA